MVILVCARTTYCVEALYPSNPVVPEMPRYCACTSENPTVALNGTSREPVALPFVAVVAVTETASVLSVAGKVKVTC